jgi:hypothetical protein
LGIPDKEAAITLPFSLAQKYSGLHQAIPIAANKNIFPDLALGETVG